MGVAKGSAYLYDICLKWWAVGNSLVAQWLGLGAFTAGARVTKILQAMQHDQKKQKTKTNQKSWPITLYQDISEFSNFIWFWAHANMYLYNYKVKRFCIPSYLEAYYKLPM